MFRGSVLRCHFSVLCFFFTFQFYERRIVLAFIFLFMVFCCSYYFIMHFKIILGEVYDMSSLIHVCPYIAMVSSIKRRRIKDNQLSTDKRVCQLSA